MGVNDPQDFNGELDRERTRLADSTDVFDADRDPLRRWLRRKSGTVEDSSLATYLRRLRLASERADTPLADLTEDDYHDLVFTLRHDHDLADSTVQSFENAVLLFVDDMRDVEWVDDVERTRVEDDGPDIDTILTPADLNQLTTTARHQRDVAFIEFLADTGARLSLALSLRVGDVDLTRPPTYTPNPEATGLKGAPIREYPLIDAAAALRSYLRTSHPRPDEPDAALFHKIKPHRRDGSERWTDEGSVRANAIRQQLHRIADRAGVEKPVNPHAFRHAAISRMVREGYSRSQIEHRVHWTLDSDMWETYEHITGEEHNDDIFAAAGLIDGDDAPDQVRKRCGNCNEPLAPRHEFCPNCGEPSSAAAEERVAEEKADRLEELVEATNAATRRELRALLDELEERPDLVHDDDPS